MQVAKRGIWAVLIVVAVGSVAAGAQAPSNQWATDMFDHTTHDFGTVARGATVEHAFTLENIYNEDLVIESVTSSCGCTTTTVSKQRLKTWEKAEIKTVVDTRRYIDRKDVTVTVKFAPPYSAEVQLHLQVFIRKDIVVQPGEVQFGTVPQGTEAARTLAISYAGLPTWAISRVECGNPSIQASLKEVSRKSGAVSYELKVTLDKTAPPGYIQDQLVLVTNDPNPREARVPVPIEGIILSKLSVRPTPLMMGVVAPGETVTKRLVVQSQVPFKIVAIQTGDARLKCRAVAEPRMVHLVEVSFTADQNEGSVNTAVRIQTDVPGEDQAITVPVHVRVMPSGELNESALLPQPGVS